MANTNYYSKFTLWAISLCIYCIIKKTIQNILDFSDDDDGICMYGEEQFNNNFFPSSLSHINKSFSKKKKSYEKVITSSCKLCLTKIKIAESSIYNLFQEKRFLLS